MAKRLFDIIAAVTGLTVCAPVLAIAAIGIRLSSPGPVFYRARRVGRDSRVFQMHKLRSMYVASDVGSAITASRDPRVFPLGRVLRRLKIDELPQLWNVLRGEMAIVGPRPEDPRIVAEHYSAEDRTTLNVRPGLTSPGSIYNYTHGERLIDAVDSEGCYVQRLLPAKLALEREYIRRAGLAYDLALIGRTIRVLAARAVGVREFAEPPEMQPVLAKSAGPRAVPVRS